MQDFTDGELKQTALVTASQGKSVPEISYMFTFELRNLKSLNWGRINLEELNHTKTKYYPFSCSVII